jgi:hypothetical protein
VPDERALPLPAVHLAGATRAGREAAEREAAAQNEQERAARQRPSPTGPVREADRVRPVGGPKGARALVVPKTKKARKKDVEKPPTPPDPNGRGRALDREA